MRSFEPIRLAPPSANTPSEDPAGRDELRALMRRVRALEEAGGHAPEGAREPDRRVRLGLGEIDDTLGGGLARGAVHEWMGVGERQEREDQWLAPVCLLTHVARRALAAMPGRWVVWVHGSERGGGVCGGGGGGEGGGGGGGLPPYGRVLVDGAGGVGDALLRRSIFVEAPDRASRLWAIDLALRCAGLACVVGDGRGFDVGATRRLQLAARAGGTLGLLARPPTEAGAPSVASSRWLVRRAPPEIGPGRADDASLDRETGHGGVRWIVELLRCKGVRPRTEASRRWALEWSFETCDVSVVAGVVGGTGAEAEPPPRRDRWRIGA